MKRLRVLKYMKIKEREIMLLLTIYILLFVGSKECLNYSLRYTESATTFNAITAFPSDDEKNIVLTKKRKPMSLYNKVVYLTFDDGPTRKVTTKILDVLAEKKVKASFFVIGRLVEQNKDIIKRMKEEGMSILPHSYTHDYSIYDSKENYFEDLNRNISVLEQSLSERVMPFIRMPGGSSNTIGEQEVVKDIRAVLKRKNISYVDWNASSMDADSNLVKVELIKESIKKSCGESRFAVILMHDAASKTTTAEALPDIIDYLRNEGFVFRTFKDITREEEREMIRRRIINK